MEGWIKLHRRITESGFWTDSYAVHLWIHLIITATYSPKKTLFNGKIVELQQGQLITGRKKLSAETGISEQIIRKWLELFEINQQITIEKTNAGSCISIVNYKIYQQDNQQKQKKLTNDQPTINQQPTTIKRNKEEEELNNDKKGVFTPPTPDQVRDYFFEIGVNGQEFEKFHDHYTANGWKIAGKTKMKDWKAACRNWKRNIEKFKNDTNGKQPKSARSEMDKLRDWYESVNAPTTGSGGE